MTQGFFCFQILLVLKEIIKKRHKSLIDFKADY